MTCVICRMGETIDGTSTVTLERGPLTLVVKGVPSQVCPNCGEAYVSAKVAERLLRDAEEAEQKGAQVAVRQYLAA